MGWGVVLACAAALLLAPPAQAGDLDRYARATWASFDAMTDRASGLPTDEQPGRSSLIFNASATYGTSRFAARGSAAD